MELRCSCAASIEPYKMFSAASQRGSCAMLSTSQIASLDGRNAVSAFRFTFSIS